MALACCMPTCMIVLWAGGEGWTHELGAKAAALWVSRARPKPATPLLEAVDPPEWRAAAVERVIAEQRSEWALLQSAEADAEPGSCARTTDKRPSAQ